MYENAQDHSQDDPDDLHNPKKDANASNGTHIIGYKVHSGIEAPVGVNIVFVVVAGDGIGDTATLGELSSGGLEIGCVNP